MKKDNLDKIKSWINPEKRDFSESTEERLISFCKQQQASENYVDKIGEFLLRVSIHYKFFKLMLYNAGAWNETMADLYQYSASMIRKIFTQARACDHYYGCVLLDVNSRAEQTNVLLKNLSSIFDKKGKKGVYDIASTSRNIWSFYMSEENIEAKKNLNTKTGPKEVTDYVLKNPYSEDPFDGCSDNVYSDMIWGDLYIKSRNHLEKNEKKLYSIIDDVLKHTSDKSIESTVDDLVKSFTEDKDLVSIIKETLDETGAVSYLESYIRLLALKQVENIIYDKYLKLRDTLQEHLVAKDIQDMDMMLSDKDTKDFIYLYDALKQTEIEIQSTYAKMHKNNTEIIINCNDKINEIEQIHIPNNKLKY